MKLAFLLFLAALCPVIVADLIRTKQATPLELWPAPSGAFAGHQGTMGTGDPSLNWNGAPLPSTNLPVTDFRAGKVPWDGTRSLRVPEQNLKPGVYKTIPYTLLVLVPGRQFDDRSIGGLGTAGTERMPAIQGGLKFIPYSFAER